MADYGLMGGIGEGLQKGLMMYQQTKQMNRNNQVQNLTSGLQEDADGNLSLSPQAQQEQQARATQAKNVNDNADATSTISATKRGLLKGELNQQQSGLGDKTITDDMSGETVDQMKGLVGQGLSANANMLKGQMMGQAMQGRVQVQQDNQSEAAVKNIHNNPAIAQMRGQALSVEKGQDQLNDPNHPPSWMQLNEVAQDYANALSSNKGSSDFKLKQSEQDNFDQKMASMKAFATSNPDQPADPAFIDFYKKMGDRLGQTYDKQLGRQAATLAAQSSKVYKHNPDAAAAQQDAADSYQNGSWRKDPSLGSGSQPAQQAPGQPGAGNQQYTPDVLTYAQQHGISPDQANAIKMQRTGGAPAPAAPQQSGMLDRIKGLIGG